MSPIAPAGSANMKNDNEEAVCVRATIVALAPRDIISHAAPTLCMKVPMSDTRLARNTSRKRVLRRGRHSVARSGAMDIGIQP
jgi:hypothetical protein